MEKQQVLGWGESVIDRLSADLQDAFPRTTGFSPRNIRDVKRFYLAYSDESIWQQPVAKLSKRVAFWEDRYHATAIESDDHLHRCLVYIDLNMVRRASEGSSEGSNLKLDS